MPVIARRFTIMTLILVNFAIAFSALAVREDRVAFRGSFELGANCPSATAGTCAGRA